MFTAYGTALRPSRYGGASNRGVKLATHLYFVPRLRMSGAITPQIYFAFMRFVRTAHKNIQFHETGGTCESVISS